MLIIERYMKIIDEDVRAVSDSVLGSDGTTPKDLRHAVELHSASLSGCGDGAEIPEEIRAWIGKVSQEAYKTLDRDVEGLTDAGYSEDAIFELTIAAAMGAARARYELAMAAVEQGGPDEA